MQPPEHVFHIQLSSKFNVVPSTGCWIWTGAQHATGYGVVKVDGVQWFIHRYANALAEGEIPAGMHVLHHCDNPLCGNPAHLFRGTHADNMADKKAKGRAVAPAAKLTAEQVQAIRFRYADGGVSYGALAAEYGISKHNVGMIIRKRIWQHV